MNRAFVKIISFCSVVFLLSFNNGFAADSPVERAVKDGNLELVKGMLESGADANAIGEYTPLYWAARGKRMDLVKLLVKYKADVNLRRQPLMSAIQYKSHEIADYLINEANLRINDRVDYMGENTYLYHAINYKNHKAMMSLLEKGASVIDVNSPYNRSDLTPGRTNEARHRHIATAIDNGDPIAIRMLLEFGANPNNLGSSDFRNVLINTNGDAKVVEAFIRKGLNVKYVSNNGHKTILHDVVDAATKKAGFNKDSIKLIITAGADINAKDGNNLTPIIYAMSLPKSNERDDLVLYLKKFQ